MKITLQPALLEWARTRAGLSVEELAEKVGVKPETAEHWEEAGELTYVQARKLAAKTHTPFGYLFLSKPPVEKLPIPDFRVMAGDAVGKPSTNLLDVIYQSQRRQDWFREHQQAEGAAALDFVGSVKPGDDIAQAARKMRERLAFHPSQCAKAELTSVLNAFSEAIEATGVLVIRAGKVGNNTSRVLDPQEFRGFALADAFAPLIFVNAADYKAAQVFTLAHELAHIWMGESALSNLNSTYAPDVSIEQFCNALAAEYLVPLDDLRQKLTQAPFQGTDRLNRLRLHYRVSELVIIRRMHDAGEISRAEFKKLYSDRLEALKERPATGGDFHRNQPPQIGRRFGAAVVESTLEGRTLYRDALSLLDFKKTSSFERFSQTLGFPSR